MPKIKMVIFMTVLFFVAGLCVSSDSFCAYEQDEVVLLQGEFMEFTVNHPRKVSIDDPGVIDIQKALPSMLFIEGKAAGSTMLRIWEPEGQRNVPFRVYREDLKKLRSRFERILHGLEIENIYLSIDNETQKIILKGEIDPRFKDAYGKAKSQFGGKIIDLVTIGPERGLIEIEAQILELTKDAQQQLGFNWSDSLQFEEDGSGKAEGLGWFGDALDDVFHVSNLTRDTISFQIGLLEKEGKLRILSRPKVVCLSGKEASFQVGGDVPIVGTTVSSTGSTQNVSFEDYGIILKVRPTITRDNQLEEDIIQTSIQTEVSDVNVSTSSGAAQINSTLVVPAFTKSSAQTELYLKDNQTVFIAGLIKSKTDDDIEKVPWLANVPILGAFFRSKSAIGEDKELVISVTPRIVGIKKEMAEKEKESPLEFDPVYSSAPRKLKGYIRSLTKRINRTVIYPELAKQAGYEGIVNLNLHILSSGELKEIVLAESSGSHILDSAAIESVQSLAPFYPFPLGIDSRDIWVYVPIEFRLD